MEVDISIPTVDTSSSVVPSNGNGPGGGRPSESEGPITDLGKMYTRFRPMLCAVARLATDGFRTCDDEDLVNDLFVSLIRSPTFLELPFPEMQYAYARKSLDRKAATFSRAENTRKRGGGKVRAVSELEAAQGAPDSPSFADPNAGPPDMEPERRDSYNAVRAVMAELSAADQQIIELRIINDLSRAEIGEMLEISIEAIDTRLSRATKRLRKIVKDRGII